VQKNAAYLLINISKSIETKSTVTSERTQLTCDFVAKKLNGLLALFTEIGFLKHEM